MPAAIAVESGELLLPPPSKTGTRCTCHYWDSQESSVAVLLTTCSVVKLKHCFSEKSQHKINLFIFLFLSTMFSSIFMAVWNENLTVTWSDKKFAHYEIMSSIWDIPPGITSMKCPYLQHVSFHVIKKLKKCEAEDWILYCLMNDVMFVVGISFQENRCSWE